ncbi:COX15/CtaA family protein [Thermocrispum municipale]|uniref:COX15/CtaA family protein n=1 Tax=Thermocrispum municipale TaxID=37926 RepID=UPI0003FA611F|nr:COX15/CtaA family protein [Thermocrispum municipale]
MQRLARLIARVPHPSTRTQWIVGLLVIITQSLIGVTGSVVRVTGSGLGCTAWPNCHPGTMFPTDHPEYATLNQWIEFGNRLLTGVVGATALAAVVIAWRLRQVDGRRRPLALALGVLAGTASQGVIGGITVLAGLLWWTVALHFLVSAVLIWLAVLLFTAFREGEREPRWLIGSVTHRLLQALVVALAAVLVAGTMVTGAGPHGGDPDTPRLALPIEVLAKVHGALLVTFLALLVVLGISLLRSPTPKPFTRSYALLWLAAVAQGVLGSAQYELGVPEELVSLHVLGAALVVICTAALWCAARDRGPVPKPDGTEPATTEAGEPVAA